VAVAQAPPARPRAGGGGRLFIIIGVVLALLGFGLAIALPALTGGGSSGTATCPASGAGCSLVVYAAKDIGLRTQITTVEQVQVKQIPDAYKPVGVFTIDATTKASEQPAKALLAVKNDIAEVNIAVGQPLLTSMLAKPGDTVSEAQAAFLPIPTGHTAITIPTSELTGVANYIQPGDYIGLLAAVGSGKNGSTATVFTQLHVIRVGPANLSVTSASNTSNSSTSSAPQAAPSSLTVVVTPCQAELIKWFVQNVQVSYELEAFTDYAKSATTADPACNGFDAAHGVQATDIIAKFPVFSKALGGP
jgi:Flp pilus assembly protein CpaB